MMHKDRKSGRFAVLEKLGKIKVANISYVVALIMRDLEGLLTTIFPPKKNGQLEISLAWTTTRPFTVQGFYQIVVPQIR